MSLDQVHLTTRAKGKVERAGIGYLRQSFWPLRAFTDLQDVNRQVRQWLAEVANQRPHRETRQRPAARRSRAQQRLFLFLDGLCSRTMVEAYLRDIADTDRALSRQLTELLELIRQYGPEADDTPPNRN